MVVVTGVVAATCTIFIVSVGVLFLQVIISPRYVLTNRVSCLLLLLSHRTHKSICRFYPGEWICRSCALELGLDVGLEGHEYKVVEENEATHYKSFLFDDSDEDCDTAPVSKKKRIRRKIIDTPESNSDSE